MLPHTIFADSSIGDHSKFALILQTGPAQNPLIIPIFDKKSHFQLFTSAFGCI